MDVGAFFQNRFRAGRAAHDGDGFARLDRFAGNDAGLDFAQVRVERINFKAVNLVRDDEVTPVIGQPRFVVDIPDDAVGGGHDGIGRLAVFVMLEAADVETLVHSPAVVAHATEAAAGPRPVGRGRGDEFQIAACVVKRVVRRGKLKWRLRGKFCRSEKNGHKHGAVGGGQNHFIFPFRIFLATLFRPNTSCVASSREASGVNAKVPLAVRRGMSGAAGQRLSPIFSLHWPKTTKCFPGLAAEFCSRVHAPVSSNFNCTANPPGASSSVAAMMFASVRTGSVVMDTCTGSTRSTEMVLPLAPTLAELSMCRRKMAICLPSFFHMAQLAASDKIAAISKKVLNRRA